MAEIKKINIHSHFISLLFVGILFLLFYFLFFSAQTEQPHPYQKVTDIINFHDSLEVNLFKETLKIFNPLDDSELNTLVTRLNQIQQKRLKEMAMGDNTFIFSDTNIKRIIKMYLKFILTYIIVMVFCYYGVQTLALYRFIKYKQDRSSCLERLIKNRFKPFHRSLGLIATSLLKGIAYTILFCPGYVLAYALKTKIDTSNYFFMIILVTFTNGLLILYSQKFFTFLIHEDRKGYIQTAMVKNLNSSYFDRSLYLSLVKLNKMFKNHILEHIYLNARYQYLSAINEQASFLITGLIIIEMALNIQNYFSYELLQHLLYRNYLIAIIMIFFIFFIVKITEIVTDYWRYWVKKKISNE
jgi:hypothetical protein